jgi:hypothetical protein
MKLNLLIGGAALNGYLNADQLFNGQNDRVQAELQDLDPIVDHNECDEVLALDILDFIPLSLRAKTLNGWMTKVAHGGTITVSCLDLSEFTRKVYNGDLKDTYQVNQILFGPVTTAWSIRKSVCTLSETVQMIMSTGQFDVVSQRFDGVHYIVTAKRK